MTTTPSEPNNSPAERRSSMTAMTALPAEAIEAAHKAWRAQAALEGSIFEYNLRAAIEAAAPLIVATYLDGLAADVKARGDIGKDEGREAWDYLTWKAEQVRTTK